MTTPIYYIAPARTAFGWRVVTTTAEKAQPKRAWRGPFDSETAAQDAALDAHQTADPHCTCNDCLTERQGCPDCGAVQDCTADCEPSEPQEDDLTTEDYRKWYQSGLLVLEQDDDNRWTYRVNRTSAWVLLGTFGDDHESAIRAYCDKTQYWPNVWAISDHGNAHRLTIHNTGEKQS